MGIYIIELRATGQYYSKYSDTPQFKFVDDTNDATHMTAKEAEVIVGKLQDFGFVVGRVEDTRIKS